MTKFTTGLTTEFNDRVHEKIQDKLCLFKIRFNKRFIIRFTSEFRTRSCSSESSCCVKFHITISYSQLKLSRKPQEKWINASRCYVVGFETPGKPQGLAGYKPNLISLTQSYLFVLYSLTG